MAKREQVLEEGLKEQQPTVEAEKEVRSIAQARAAYEQLMDEICGSVSKQGNYVNRRQSCSDQDEQIFRLEKRFNSC